MGVCFNLIPFFQRKQEQSTAECFLKSERNVSQPVPGDGTRWFLTSKPCCDSVNYTWPETAVVFLQVARKLVILEGELERAEERAEVSEV